MGACLSSAAPKARKTSESEGSNPKAIVISENGDLLRFELPMTVSQVLLALHSEAAKPGAKFFLCNSDCLYYDEFIPALDGDHQLQPNQIYFVLPASKLRYRLSASDMAALAVKASVAFQNPSSPSRNSKSKERRSSSSSVFHYPHRLLHRHKKVARISPLLEEVNITSSSDTFASSYSSSGTTLSESSTISTYLGVSRSTAPTTKKYLRRTSSIRRAKMAVRSFRLSLTTIHEGSVLQAY